MIRAALSMAPGELGKEITWDEAKTFLAGTRPEGASLWVDTCKPSADEVAELAEIFQLHPLTVEDLVHRNQRAKIEEYPGYVFVVMHWHNKMGARPYELHCALGKGYLLSVVDSGDDPPPHDGPVRSAWTRFVRGTSNAPTGADGILYRLLDELTDAHLPRVDEIEDRLEALNERVVDEGESPHVVHELMQTRKDLVGMRRVLAPERDVLSALARRDYHFIQERTTLFFRDVQDHLNRVYETLESLRELTEMVMEVHLAFAESQRSRVIKRLTIVSTIFLPMNFLGSFFGMNFTKIPYDSPQLLATCLVAMVLLPLGFMLWFTLVKWV